MSRRHSQHFSRTKSRRKKRAAVRMIIISYLIIIILNLTIIINLIIMFNVIFWAGLFCPTSWTHCFLKATKNNGSNWLGDSVSSDQSDN